MSTEKVLSSGTKNRLIRAFSGADRLSEDACNEMIAWYCELYGSPLINMLALVKAEKEANPLFTWFERAPERCRLHPFKQLLRRVRMPEQVFLHPITLNQAVRTTTGTLFDGPVYGGGMTTAVPIGHLCPRLQKTLRKITNYKKKAKR